MAREPEQVRLKVVDEAPEKGDEVLRLKPSTSDYPMSDSAPATRPGRVLLHSAVPAPVPPAPERLEIAPGADRRTHEPGIDVLIQGLDQEAKPLEETWNDDSRGHQSLPWGWFVLIGLICGSAVVWSIVNLRSNQSKPELARDESLALLDQDERENAAAEVRVNRIQACVKSYVAASSIEQLLPLVRQSDRVHPLMESWYARNPLKSDPFASLETFQPLTLASKASFWRVACKLASGTTRQLLVEELPDSRVAVDWETDVAYQPMDWDQYARERTAGTFEFRVRAEPGFLYSHEFADSNRWMSFRLTTVRAEETLYGYVDRNSDTAKMIVQLLERNNNAPVALILRITTPTGLRSPHGVVIERVLSPHWLYLEPPAPDA